MKKHFAVLGLSGWVADRSDGGIKAAPLLAERFAAQFGQKAILLSDETPPADFSIQNALEHARPYLTRVSDRLGRILTDGYTPIIFENRCAVSLATLPPLFAHVPDACLVWLDAHGEFNTPETSRSGYLGGMHLSAVCGLWDSGLGGGLVPNRLILVGARDLDPEEKDLICNHRVHLTPLADGEIDVDTVLRAIDRRPVFVHLDLDVLNPGLLPTEYQVAGGLTPSGVRELFTQLANSCEIVAFSVAELNFAAERFDADCKTVFSMIEPLTRRTTAAVR